MPRSVVAPLGLSTKGRTQKFGNSTCVDTVEEVMISAGTVGIFKPP